MRFRDILDPKCVRLLESSSSKKRLIESLAETIAAASPGLDARALFDHLMARERLGTTGLGEGVAIPHCRLPGRSTPLAAFVKLAQPLDFDAPDARAVDLVFVLAVPENAHQTHLDLLARLAAVFSEEDNRRSLRACTSENALRDRLLELLGET
jgi:PTS system nitrogen regulatory IIA component